MHTLNRLKEHELLKLKDELSFQESKYIWKWKKYKIPKSLKEIVSEQLDNLRARWCNMYVKKLEKAVLWKDSHQEQTPLKSIVLITMSRTKKSLSTIN